MANTNMDALYPEFWAAAFDELDKGSYNLHNLVNRKYEPQVANTGDTVNVPLTPDMTAEDWTPGDAITPTGITQANAQVVLNGTKKATIALTDKDMSMSAYELIKVYGLAMAQAIIEAVNLAIYKEAIKSSYFINPGTPGTTAVDEDDIVDARTLLSKNKVANFNRILVASPDEAGTLLKTDAFQRADASGDGGKAMAEGQLGKKFGFAIFENNVIADYTPADVAGAVNLSAGYAAGDKSMIVDGFNDDANPLRAGDIFHLGSGTNHYSIQSTSLTTGDTTGITFANNGSGLVETTVANDVVINVDVTRSALCFVPSAIAFAARPYAALNKPGVLSSIINVDGLPVRISVWTDSSTLNTNIQADVLFGVKLINEKRMVRILA